MAWAGDVARYLWDSEPTSEDPRRQDPAVRAAVAGLPRQERALAELVLERPGLSLVEIADVLDIEPDAARQRLHRLLKRLEMSRTLHQGRRTIVPKYVLTLRRADDLEGPPLMATSNPDLIGAVVRTLSRMTGCDNPTCREHRTRVLRIIDQGLNSTGKESSNVPAQHRRAAHQSR